MGQAKQKRAGQCRCRSGKTAGECCYGPNGWFKNPAVINLAEAGETSSHEKCYLRAEGTCSDKISREHLVSESVLKVLAEKEVEITGLPFLKGEKKRLGFGALTTNKLCRAHNSALSPLDSAGAFFFSAVQTCGTTVAGESQHFLLSGHDLERWMFRTFAAMAVSGNFAVDGVSLQRSTYEELPFASLLQKPEEWKPPLGLYFTRRLNTKFGRKDEFQLAPLMSTITNDLIGIHVDIQGLWIGLIGAPHDIRDTIFKDAIYRPGQFIFRMGRCEHTIVLSWQDGFKHGEITLTLEP